MISASWYECISVVTLKYYIELTMKTNKESTHNTVKYNYQI